MKLSHYCLKDAESVCYLFHAAVHAISAHVYTPEQCEAWAPTPPDVDFWRHSLVNMQTTLCWVDSSLAGFITVTESGHIDFLYTHPQCQRRGVALTLYNYVENIALQKHQLVLTVNASKIAQQFFTRQGFVVTRKNTVERKAQTLVSFYMVKHLPNRMK